MFEGNINNYIIIIWTTTKPLHILSFKVMSETDKMVSVAIYNKYWLLTNDALNYQKTYFPKTIVDRQNGYIICCKHRDHQYLRGDDFDGCHEAIGNDWHTKEHVHETREVDNSPPCLLSHWRIKWQPHWKHNTGPAHHFPWACPFTRSV